MPFNVFIKQTVRVTQSDGFATDDRSVEYKVETVKITSASAYNHTYRSISAGLSAQQINLEPVNASNPGQFIWLQSDQPINIRLGSTANSATVSEAYQLLLVNSNLISSLFIDVPGSLYAANLSVRVFRGGTITLSTPLA